MNYFLSPEWSVHIVRWRWLQAMLDKSIFTEGCHTETLRPFFHTTFVIKQVACFSMFWETFTFAGIWRPGGVPKLVHYICKNIWFTWPVTIAWSRENSKTGPRLNLVQRLPRSQCLSLETSFDVRFCVHEIWRWDLVHARIRKQVVLTELNYIVK